MTLDYITMTSTPVWTRRHLTNACTFPDPVAARRSRGRGVPSRHKWISQLRHRSNHPSSSQLDIGKGICEMDSSCVSHDPPSGVQLPCSLLIAFMSTDNATRQYTRSLELLTLVPAVTKCRQNAGVITCLSRIQHSGRDTTSFLFHFVRHS